MSENTLLIIAVLIFAPIFGVLLYNTYQEKKYRDAVRAQFGHADKDALLESRTHSVRDGKVTADQDSAETEPVTLLKPALKRSQPQPATAAWDTAEDSSTSEATVPPKPETAAAPKNTAEPVLQTESVATPAPSFSFKTVPVDEPSQTKAAKGKLLLDLHDLAKQDLPTFGYNMIDPLKSWCWGAILFYPFKISRFS